MRLIHLIIQMVYYLKGGREHISFKGPDKVNVKLNGSNIIPANTPPGIHYLGVVIDAGNKVKESN